MTKYPRTPLRQLAALTILALLGAACGTTLPVENLTAAGSPQDPSLAAPGAAAVDGTATSDAPATTTPAADGTGGTGGTGSAAEADGGGPAATTPVAPGATGGRLPTSDHPGVSDDEIAVGISLFKAGDIAQSIGVDLGFGNTQAQAQAVVDWFNANGGIAGRQIRPVYYTVDFGRSGQVQDGQFEQEACAKWTEDDKVFAAINNTMARQNVLTCLADRDVVGLHDGLPVDDALAKKYFNHYYSPSAPTLDRTARFQLSALGPNYFRGSKVGIMYFNDPAYKRVIDTVFVPMLKSLGASDVVLQGAPRGGQVEALSAVSAFQRQGVTHVTFFGEAGAYPLFFMRGAQNQGYAPKYFLNSNHQVLTLESGAPPQQLRTVTGQGWVPSLDVTAGNDPGPVSANNELCLRIQRDAGQDMSVRGAYVTAMGYCTGLIFLRDALSRASALTSAGMADGVARLGDGFQSANVFATFVDGSRHDAPNAYREFRFKCANQACSAGSFQYTAPTQVMP